MNKAVRGGLGTRLHSEYSILRVWREEAEKFQLWRGGGEGGGEGGVHFHNLLNQRSIPNK